jgi:hypothetical protein
MEADIFECMVVEGHELGLGAPKSSPSNEYGDCLPSSFRQAPRKRAPTQSADPQWLKSSVVDEGNAHGHFTRSIC